MSRQYGPEQKLVIDTFQKCFDLHKQYPIVLYGTGKNTEAVLSGTKGFRFVGLMDQAVTGETVYNRKVLNDDEIIKIRPIIVIIARQSVVNIIFKRIQYLSVEYGIPVYDFQGNLLGQEHLIYRNEELSYWEVSELELINKIRENDMISFDIFDTLLMRRVLQPTDVFELVEAQLKSQGCDYPFASIRMKAENALKDCPGLDEIYEKMQELLPVDNRMISRMKKLECDTDAEVLLRREKMCRIFRLALDEGKKVYLLSDMYYSKAHMEKLLQQNGIAGYQDLFVSCEIKGGKSDGALYQKYLSQAGFGSKLHIGDNRRADVEKAREHEINTFHIYSAYELLMASSLQDVLADADTLQKRCILGLLISRVFNDPFSLYSTKGYFTIKNICDVGYCFVAPMLTEFVKWFILQIKERKIQQILFPSRDGFLLKKVYELMIDCDVNTVYFRTSRRAAAVAGIQDSADIKRIASRKYQGTYADYLKQRFGIAMRDTDIRGTMIVKESWDELTQQILKDYEYQILKNARTEREQYLRYFERKGLLTDKAQAIFDFVAGGTVQYNLTRLLHHDILGLYFATMNLPNEMYDADTDDIRTAYGNIQSYKVQNQLGKYYLFLETILVDGSESFSHIDAKGTEIFERKSPAGNYREIEKLQTAVLEFVSDYQRYFSCINTDKPELEFVDQLFGMLFSDRCIVEEEIKKVFSSDDIYDGIGAYQLWEEKSECRRLQNGE